LLAKNHYEPESLDAELLAEQQPTIIANAFGTFLLNFSISLLGQLQEKPRAELCVSASLDSSLRAIQECSP
jgi:hypothetical protein